MTEMAMSFVANMGVMTLATGLYLLFQLKSRPGSLDLGCKVFLGVVFGITSVLLIHFPVINLTGGVLDLRAVPIVAAAFYGGPLSGLVAAVIVTMSVAMLDGAVGFDQLAILLIFAGAGLFARVLNGDDISSPLRLFVVGICSAALIGPGFLVGNGTDASFSALLAYLSFLLVANGTVFVMVGMASLHAQNYIAATTAVNSLSASLDQMEQRLDAQRASVRLAVTAKDRFLSQVNHELRTPLNAIIGFAQMIKNIGVDNLARHQIEDYVTDIESSGHSLMEIVDDLLELSPKNKNTGALSIDGHRPSELIETVLASLNSLSASKGIQIKIDEVTEALVRCDNYAVNQCLSNLISNAIKYSSPGSMIRLSVIESDDGIAFNVDDRGVGIPSIVLQNVGQPFLRGDDPLTQNLDGPGLGLAMTKKLIELQQGCLRLIRKPDVGTFASIVLPKQKTSLR